MTSQPHITLNPVIDKEEEVRVRPRVNDMEDLPAHGDADARGEYWYDYKRSSEKRENIDHKDFSGSFSRSVNICLSCLLRNVDHAYR